MYYWIWDEDDDWDWLESMSFYFEESTNNDWRCKDCGTEIELDEYRRLMYCRDCEDRYELRTHGRILRVKIDDIDVEVTQILHEGWEEDLLIRLEQWTIDRRRNGYGFSG